MTRTSILHNFLHSFCVKNNSLCKINNELGKKITPDLELFRIFLIYFSSNFGVFMKSRAISCKCEDWS